MSARGFRKSQDQRGGWSARRNELRVDSIVCTWWYGFLVATFKVSREGDDGTVANSMPHTFGRSTPPAVTPQADCGSTELRELPDCAFFPAVSTKSRGIVLDRDIQLLDVHRLSPMYHLPSQSH